MAASCASTASHFRNVLSLFSEMHIYRVFQMRSKCAIECILWTQFLHHHHIFLSLVINPLQHEFLRNLFNTSDFDTFNRTVSHIQRHADTIFWSYPVRMYKNLITQDVSPLYRVCPTCGYSLPTFKRSASLINVRSRVSSFSHMCPLACPE